MRKDWELLLACFLSEQMNVAQLYRHFEDDPDFKTWFDKQMEVRK